MSVNQGKSCDAVVRVLEAREGAERTNVRHPERDSYGPPVELRFRLGVQEYAIEHTQIEAFPNQLYANRLFKQLTDPVVAELSGRLPGPAVYHLFFPNNTRLDVPSDKLRAIQNDLVEWVREHAQHLHEENSQEPTRERYPHGIRTQFRDTPPGFCYNVVLQREAHWSFFQRNHGVLLAASFAPEYVETLRVDRLRNALERKCPKLGKCKDEGARTVLVLEDNDISLSNYALIGKSLKKLLRKCSDVPDEVYLVETSLNTMWIVRLMQSDGKWLGGKDWIESDFNDLIDITAFEPKIGPRTIFIT